MKKIYDILTCALIGWDYEILKQCREASYRTKNKYVSALIIVSIIWGVIGYKFASKYIGLGDTLESCMVAFMFIVIVNCIERIIIMKQGKNPLVYIFRGILALCMAFLGSFIFDQIMFSQDLETQINRDKELEIKEVVNLRMEECNNDIQRYNLIRDSLVKDVDEKYVEYQKKPTIDLVTVDIRFVPDGVDENGNPKYRQVREVKHTLAENSIMDQIRADTTELGNTKKMLQQLQEKKDSIGVIVRHEIMGRSIGFMEELNASHKVFFASKLTTFVYILLFIFMLGLELFVCSISWVEKDCDYDLIVEHQLQMKGMELKDTEKKYTQKYITREIED